MTLLRPGQPKPKKQSVFKRVVNKVKDIGNSLLEGPKERFQAVRESIKTRSLTPLRQSFARQGQQLAETYNARTPEGAFNVVSSFAPTPGKTVPKAPKKPSVFREIKKQVQPSINTVAQEGAAGKELAQRITRAADTGEIAAGKRVSNLRKAPKLNRAENLNLSRVLEGKAAPLNKNVEKAATLVRAELDDVAREAMESGVVTSRRGTVNPGDDTKGLTNLQRERLAEGKPVKATIREPFKPRENYFPHIIPDTKTLASGKVRADVVDNLVQSGVSKTIKDAERFVDDYRNFIDTGARTDSLLKYMTETGQAANEAEALANLQRYRQRTIKKQGSLEFSRQVDLPFYDPDPSRVLPKYLTDTSKRLAQIKELGQKNETVNKLISEIRKSGGDADIVRTAVDRILSITNSTSAVHKASVFFRTLQGFKLGLAAIPNSFQALLNSPLKGDIPATIIGIMRLFTKEGRELGLRSGSTLESVVQEAGKASGGLSTFLKATGFTATERFNRTIAANAGRSYGSRLAKSVLKNPNNKKARSLLEELGVNVDDLVKRGQVSDDDILMMAKKFTDLTQFRSRPQDLPIFASSDAGKVFFQFKNFIYGQTRLVHQATIGELRAGRFGRATRNLLWLATAFPLAGEIIADVRGLITGRKRESEGLARYFENIAQTGAMGILMDAIKAGGVNKGTEFIAGPTIGDSGDFINAVSQAFNGNSKALGRFFLKRVPIIGSRLSESAIPTKKAKPKGGSRLRRNKQ